MPAEVPTFVPAIKNWDFRPEKGYQSPEYAPSYFPELPYHLRKFVLRRIQAENSVDGRNIARLWDERSLYIERRVENLVAQISGVSNLSRYERYAKGYSAGKDLQFDLDGMEINVEIKSSRFGVHEFKRMIGMTHFPDQPYDEEAVGAWMTEHHIILVNGAETRSNSDIMNKSFYPQLERIKAYEAENAA
jgi:hypothetical protein